MLISKDFVFIHMPKTGGTFVHGIFKKIVQAYKDEHPLRWYLNRFLYRLGLTTPIYQKLIGVKYDEYPNQTVNGQHAGVAYIPKRFKKLPIISVKRDPIEKFISAYYFRWWERFPNLKHEYLTELFPEYPNITISDYFKLVYEHEMKHFFHKDYREDIGVLSWQFIRMYSRSPLQVYRNIDEDNFADVIKEHFYKVDFFEMKNLNEKMSKYLKGTSFAPYAHYFNKSSKIYPPGSRPDIIREEISRELRKEVKAREWILYNYFSDYNL